MTTTTTNADRLTVEGFGLEWTKFDQGKLSELERLRVYEDYFAVFPWDSVGNTSEGADIGCGSGRWATIVAPKVGMLHLVDASEKAVDVARRNVHSHGNCNFVHASVGNLPFEDGSLDFAYSLGVLHHVPNTASAIASIASKLKPGAPLLLYLYYNFDNRPIWYVVLWKLTDVVRRALSKMPFSIRVVLCRLLAATVYWPLARVAKILSLCSMLPASWPLSYYRDKAFYVMKTDALDRFGTRLERRFSRAQIERMLAEAGFREITFSTRAPYWCVVAIRC
jgi:ubiquinone/menaquinone biosynthesis C-methylase UbiE